MATTTTRDVTSELTSECLAKLSADFDTNPTNRLMQNAIAQTTVTEVALDRQIVTSIDHSFSNVLDDWSVTNQKKSGRCWLFAGLNLFRVAAMKQMNLKEFEFSQNHALFWDKLERSNYFLESIIRMSDREADDRTIAWILADPLGDGGQWNMFINIIKKHGLVPKAAMPETESSSNTRRMNDILVAKLREGAQKIREHLNSEQNGDSVELVKNEIVAAIYRILCIHLGTPPSTFDWQWNDKDRDFGRDGQMTPLEFAEKYVTVPVDDYVCLVHDPRSEHPYGKTYTVDCLGNVVGGEIVKYLNVDIETMKKVAMQTIVDGEPVWMGCDVAKMLRRDLGIWDAKLFDYDGVYSTTFGLNKAGRLAYHETLMTHAMLFTGVDVVDSKPRRWRVENSWGEEGGMKGFYVMNDSWFDEYMFEIAARRSYLPQDLQDAIDQEPTVLPAWDPKGALAR